MAWLWSMNKKQHIQLTALIALLSALNPQPSTFAQGTAFTYQGRLTDQGNPANGSYDLTFAVFDALTAGTQVSGTVTNGTTSVSNGQFTVSLDFGPGVFTGSPRWLEVGVQTNGGGGFATLNPRQQLTPMPYAIYSANSAHADIAAQADQAGSVASGTISAPQLSTSGAPGTGQVLGYSGTQLVWQDPVIGGSTGGWALTGNLGTSPVLNFLGTLDNQPVELHVGGTRALRLEPDATGSGAPNVIGGSPANYVSNSVVGATIGGGGGLNLSNSVTASFAAIGGGVKNIAGGQQAFVGGGYQNKASGYISTVAGGAYNVANGSEAFVGGGAYNMAELYSVVAGGDLNTANGVDSVVVGGLINTASGDYSFVGGGSDTSDVNDTLGNVASGGWSVVVGGDGNHATGDDSSVVGGANNTASGVWSAVPGGALNVASGVASFAAGYNAHATTQGAFVWADNSSGSAFTSSANYQFLMRATGGVGIGTAQTPPGGLRVASGGLAVTGASSPSYPGSTGVFIEKVPNYGGAVYAYDYNANGPLSLALNSPGGNVGIGTLTPQNTLDVNGTTRTHSIIITGGADLAEPFKMGSQTVQKGSVVVIDAAHPGELKLSTSAYDTHVAGIVSGANGINPGIALQQEGMLEGGQNVALTGRVYVLADATHDPIQPGDLLTTSDTPGHAMKVSDHARAQGAILGKAMTTLTEGKGMVLVLVTLQ
jgi:hypothetical protein